MLPKPFFFLLLLLGITLAHTSKAQEIQGYVLTHEHPTQGMAFGGNYAFTGAAGNYQNGVMENGYTAQCGGCSVAGICDHGEAKGSLGGLFLGKDIGVHSSYDGPLRKSFSHLRYSTEWIKEAHKPTEEKYQDSRARIMVAFAVENESMCEQLYYVNDKDGGDGHEGYGCTKGDSFPSMKRQLDAMKDWVAANSDDMQIAYTPAEARDIINDDKLAIILGIESEYSFGSEASTFDPVDRLNTYIDEGVRTFYLSHKINSRLTGADVYLPRGNSSGKALRMSQAISGCFYYDDHVGEFPLYRADGYKYCGHEKRCGNDAFKGAKITDTCSYKLSDISEANLSSYILLYGSRLFNGFEIYPLPPSFTPEAMTIAPANTGGTSYNSNTDIERNNLGLSHEGERVVREAMLNGMIVNIDHVSSKGRTHMREISRQFNNYPLNALHNKPNERLTDKGSYRRHEYDLDSHELDYITETGGFFGLRMGPTDSLEDHEGAVVDGFDSGISNDCANSSTETGKMLAWLLEKGLSVGYSLDFATITQAVYSRTTAKCNFRIVGETEDDFNLYDGHITEGLSHIGMMKKWHNELEAVGLRSEYLNQLKNDGAEQFLQMWEASVAKRNEGQQIPRRTFESAQKLVGASCDQNAECMSNKCQGSNGNKQCVCNIDDDCASGEFCNNRLGANRCLRDGTLNVGDSCLKNKECQTNKCQGSGDNRECVCNNDSDCANGQFCNNRLGQNRCLANGTSNVGETCDKNAECRSGKCQGSGSDRECVCNRDSDCSATQYCNNRASKNRCLSNRNKDVGQSCSKNQECRTGKCQGNGANRECVCAQDTDCPSGDKCKKRLGKNRCE